MNIITTNSDNTIQFSLLDSEGAAIDPTSEDVQDVIIAIYQNKDVVLQKFSLEAGTVIVDDAVNGLVSANVDKANLKGIFKKRIYGELVLVLNNNNFAGNSQRIVITDIVIADVKESVLNGN